MITWKDNKRFVVDGVNFIAVDCMGRKNLNSTSNEFVVNKHEWMIARYENLINKLKPKNIFELGIQRGGSCVFFQIMANADKLVAIEIDEERVVLVDQYVKNNGLHDNLVLYYGVNQSNVKELQQIVHQEFQGKEIDLVVDDASHFLDETRSSFNALFPFLRPGGAYVIEDWPWAHGKIDLPDDAEALYSEREPLTKLIFEIILACPSTYSFIEDVVVDSNSVTVWRGEGVIDVESFDISRCALARGRRLISEH